MLKEWQNVSEKLENIYELKWMWKLPMVVNQFEDEYEHVFKQEKHSEFYSNIKLDLKIWRKKLYFSQPGY
jgi:hypothetical protein